MSVLVLKLASPMQSWGVASRFTRRETHAVPTKSGIVGLLAAAQGRRRADPVEDLAALELAVRTDQPGVERPDFHTARHQLTGKSMPLTDRFYWHDAVFTAFVGGPPEVLEGLAQALDNPTFPLFFGRRSCVPTGRVVQGIREGSTADVVRDEPWHAGEPARNRMRRQRVERVTLAVQADQSVYPEAVAGAELQDVPVSYSPERRVYRFRSVVDTSVSVATGFTAPAGASGPHDPMAELGGGL